MPDLAVNR